MSDSPDDCPEDEVRTLVEIPEGSILLGAVEVCSYLDEDGDTAYGFRWPGNMSYSSVLGHLELVKAQVIHHHLHGRLPHEDD